MKKIYTLLCSIGAIAIIFFSQTSFSQGTWTQKANFGGAARFGVVSLTIGTKGYMGTGYDGTTLYQDFWQYDPQTDSWTQEATFPGVARFVAVGFYFSVGTKGYIGTGWNGSGSTDQSDFWEYDQSTNVWTQKANFGGGQRNGAVGFSIGNKGYIGTGWNITDSPIYYHKDLWEYDPATDVWTRKADFGGSGRQTATGFSIGSKGYIGLGADGSTNFQDFWEYDQASDTWTQKSNFPAPGRQWATAFSIGTKGYMGTGGTYPSGPFYNDIWEYDQATDIWTQKANVGGTGRTLASGFSIGTKGYLGTGYDGSFQNDFWEYDPQGCSITVNAGVDQTVCANNANTALGGISSTGSGTWTTSGSGTFFPNANTLNATYSPSIADITAGTLTLTLTSSNNGSCNAVSDIMITNITPLPAAPTAIDLGSKDTCANNQTISGNAIWFKFIAKNQLSTSVTVNNLPNNSHNYVQTIDIYHEDCSGLNLFVHKSAITASDTSSIKIDTSGFISGDAYFVKLSSNGNTSFNICLNSFRAFCGFDDIMKMLRQNNPDFQRQIDSSETALRNYNNNPHPNAAPYNIPVVVHVLHRPSEIVEGQGFNITYDQIKWQIQALNAAYGMNYPAYNGQSHGPSAINTQIHFCLASNTTPSSINWATDASGNPECGVMRYSVSNSILEHDIYNGQSALLAVTHPTGTEFPFNMYMNIWLVGEICNNCTNPPACTTSTCNNNPIDPPGIVGYATFPAQPVHGLDGLVFRSDAFGDNSVAGNHFSLLTTPDLQQGKILAHEVGHYLELWHTHEPFPLAGPTACVGTTGPAPSADPCDVNGDRCCDTPPTTITNYICSGSTFSCGTFSQVENYMSYSDDNCMNTFTNNQFQRMDFVLNTGGFRQNLVSSSNLIATGACSCPMIVANIGYTPSVPCPGAPVCFTTTNGAGAVSWQWNFGDGCLIGPGSGNIPAASCATGTFINPCHTYISAGTYVVTLIVTDANGNTYPQSVNVVVTYPTAQIIGLAPTVCNGSQQCINIQFTGNPPFSVTLTDGNSSYNLVNISASHVCWPVVVNSSNPTFTLNNFSDALCQGNTPSSITFIVQCCGSELWTNGNFQAYTGCLQSPSTTPLVCGSSAPGTYSVNNISFVVPPMGNYMFIDGPSPLTLPGPPLHQNLICQQIPIPTQGNYLMSFFVSEGSLPNGNFPNSAPYPFEVGVSVAGNVLGQASVPTKSIINPMPATWVPINFQLLNLSTGTQQVCICQTTFSGSGGYDYALDNISLKPIGPVVPIASFTNPTCQGSCNGTANATATGGTPPYSFSWNTTPVQNVPNIVGLCPGNYAVTVTDANGCSSTANVTINPGAAPPIPSISSTNVTCQGLCNGTANATATGGTAPYSFSWNTTPVQNIANIVGLCAGNYVVTVTDANGCTATANVTINPGLPLPTASISYPNPLSICAGGIPVNVIQTGQGGGTYSFAPAGLSINTSTGTINPAGSAIGNYIITYSFTGANGCSNTITTNVSIINCCSTTCTALGTSGMISSNPTSGISYCIHNNVAITNNVLFSASEFIMDPSVTITVNSGRTLTISNCHLWGCPNMWQGIVVQAGAKLIIQGNSFIEDAVIAVTVNQSSLTSGYALQVDGAIFNRNMTSIQISNYLLTVAVYPYMIRDAIFTCRNIPTSGPFTWPATSAFKNLLNSNTLSEHYSATNYSGALLKYPNSTLPSIEGVKLLTVGFSSPPSYYEIVIGDPTSSKMNLYDNVKYGIYAQDATFQSINSAFQYMAVTGKGGNSGGIAIYANRTSKLHRAQILPSIPVSITNKFYDCRRAAEIHNYNEVNIQSANVRSTQAWSSGTTINPIGDYGFYIATNNYRQIDVRINTLTNINNGIVFIADAIPSFPYTQYQSVGPVNIIRNTIQANLPSLPVTSQFVYTAISATDVISIYNSSAGIFGSPGTNIDIASNTIHNAFRGIYMANWQKQIAIANYNNITMNQEPNNLLGNPTDQYGIKQANNIANKIINNNVSGTSINKDKWRGVWTDMNMKQIVRCNDVSNVGRGFEFDNTQSGTTFWDNTMSNLKKGLVMMSNAVIDPQASPTVASDNQWTGTWTPYGNYKTFTDLNVNPLLSKLYVRQNPPSYNPSGVGFNGTMGVPFLNDYNASGAINLIHHSPNRSCPAPKAQCPNCQNASITFFVQVALDSITFQSLPVQTAFIAKNNLFRTLSVDSTLLDSSVVLQNFYTASQNMSRGTLAKIEHTLKKNNLSSAGTMIAGFVPASTIETNYKTFYSVYINHKANTLISVSDSANLFDLANSCPAMNGAVVYQARALFNSVYDIYREFDDNCQEASARMQQSTDNVVESVQPKYLIYPNPTTGEIYISCADIPCASIQITVMDITGKKLFTEKPAAEGNIAKINVNLADGIYLIQITNTLNAENSLHKLVIQK